MREQAEDTIDNCRVARNPDRTGDSEAQVGDHAAFPPADFVSEDAKSPKPFRSDRSLSNNASFCTAVGIRYRCHLDRNRFTVCGRRNERRMEQAAATTPIHRGRDCLEEPSEEPNDALASSIARSEGDPVQVETHVVALNVASASASRTTAIHVSIVRSGPGAQQGAKVRV